MSPDQRYASEGVVIQAPMSFVGATRRIWKMTRSGSWLIPVAVILVFFAWLLIVTWYCAFGVFVVPWRLLRRGQRKRKQEELRHREVMGR